MMEVIMEVPDGWDKDFSNQKLVRCKDCKHGEPCKNGRGEDAVECFNSDVCLEVICRNPNWFCADGESKL